VSRITDLSAAVVSTCPATNSAARSAAPGGSSAGRGIPASPRTAVVRVIVRHQHPGTATASDAATPLAILGQGRRTDPRKATMTARFLALTAERHAPLASIPLDRIARISADLAPRVGLHPGAARTALRKAVITARTGDPR
jgi:hypothetical protein